MNTIEKTIFAVLGCFTVWGLIRFILNKKRKK